MLHAPGNPHDGEAEDDAKLAQFPEKDVHSHARLRVNGVVMNCDLWYDLFGVDRNCKLYLPQERRAYIW